MARETRWGYAVEDAAPRERVDTLPLGIPDDYGIKTLGYGMLAWYQQNLVQPNGPRAKQPYIPTLRQARYTLWLYAVDDEGRWLFNRAVRRLAKGSGKSPDAAKYALGELMGPCRLLDFDDRLPGGVIGQPMSMPLIQIAATSERQTANTMRMVRAFANKRTKVAKRYQIDVGKTFIDTPEGGRLEQITSSAGAAEGAESSTAIGDETEHWVPGNGGPELAQTMVQNSAKTSGRFIETCNAWVPGIGSVAEATFEAWVLEQEGRTLGDQHILYDAVVAPHNTVLSDNPEPGQVSLSDALAIVYEDTPWVPQKDIKAQILSPTYPPSRSRRFFLNQPNAVETAWVTVGDWAKLADQDRELIDGEEIVLFFDGSKSNDHTALVGCCMEDGHIFTLGVWEPDKTTGVINADAVDAEVDRTFQKYKVLAFYADVREWESYVKTSWPKKYKDQLIMWAVTNGKSQAPIAWDMRSHGYQFAEAAEMCHAEIMEGMFTHDGNWATSKHIGNARATESRGRITIKKESPKSANKIDAAVCVIGARMVYRNLLASKEWEKHNQSNDFAFFV